MADEKGVEVSISTINVKRTTPNVEGASKTAKNVLYVKWYAPAYGTEQLYRARTVHLDLESGEYKKDSDYLTEKFLFKEKIIGKSKITFELFEEIEPTELEKFLTSLFKIVATAAFGLFTGGGLALPIASGALQYFLGKIKVEEKTVYSIGQATLEEVDSENIPKKDQKLKLMVEKEIKEWGTKYKDPARVSGEKEAVLIKDIPIGENGTITINFKLL